MNPEQPFANAMAIDNGRIIAIGENEQILTGWNAEQTVNFHQAHVFPGFIDAHAHLYGLGEESRILSLIGTRSSAEVLAEVLARTKATPEGEWIRGRGWDQNDWKDRSFPNAAELDRVSPNHPIMLSRIDGHAVWVNSRALQIAGITHETADPDGGRILRLPDASPSGVLLDNAIELVRSHIPEPGPEDLRAAYLNAVQRCLALGLTGVHDMGLSANRIAAIRALIDSNAFPLRVVGYIDGRGEEWEALLRTGRTDYGDKRLVLAGLKLYADGALGSRGAWLMDDYSDDPGNRGIAIESYDVIRSEAKRAMKQRLQVCVHAIGDAAVRMSLDAFERALKEVSRSGPPMRIEHAQVIAEEDIIRFPRLGIVPSMQPTHCTSDMYWAEARLGVHRITRGYAWQSLIDAGSWIAGGSDFPVERPDPLRGMYAAAFRRDIKGRPATQEDIERYFQIDPALPHHAERYRDGWYGSERMSRLDAVQAFTIWAARAAGMDRDLGSLERRKFADFVVLTKDILTVPREEFLSTRVVATWLQGREVWSAARTN